MGLKGNFSHRYRDYGGFSNGHRTNTSFVIKSPDKEKQRNLSIQHKEHHLGNDVCVFIGGEKLFQPIKHKRKVDSMP